MARTPAHDCTYLCGSVLECANDRGYAGLQVARQLVCCDKSVRKRVCAVLQPDLVHSTHGICRHTLPHIHTQAQARSHLERQCDRGAVDCALHCDLHLIAHTTTTHTTARMLRGGS